MRKKLTVGVIMGGASVEHEVSLASGEQVLKNLDKKKYRAVLVKVSKTGQWFWKGKVARYLDIFKKIDLAFLAVHGEFGEDGRLQGLLDFHDVSYTGSGMAASALAMDKLKSRELFNLAGLTTPKTLFVDSRLSSIEEKISFPVMVKPRSRGSSVGIQPAHNKKELAKALKFARKFEGDILVEEYLKGTEVTCGVLESPDVSSRGFDRKQRGFKRQKYFALPLTEIIPVKRKFFDYKAKYTPGASQEITPARVSAKETKIVQEAALKAHQLLGCAGYSRADFILARGRAYLLEVNTLPGLTGTSLLPQGAAAVGLTFSQLLDSIVESSFTLRKDDGPK